MNTPIFDALKADLGFDPLAPIPWLLLDAAHRMKRWLAWGGSASQEWPTAKPSMLPSFSGYSLAEHRRRSDQALRAMLRDEDLTVEYRRWP